jgi:hypothetical protein
MLAVAKCEINELNAHANDYLGVQGAANEPVQLLNTLVLQAL